MIDFKVSKIIASKLLKKIIFVISFSMFASSVFSEVIVKSSCWYQQKSPDLKIKKEQGCEGLVGLMRLSREITTTPFLLEKASINLFGSSILPSVGTEVVLKRSAHLRHEYFAERDDQYNISFRKICTGIGCRNNFWKGICTLLHENVNPKLKIRKCPGPTDDTEYFAAGTTVRILGYQQFGMLFALVQIIKVEGTDPEEEEKKYKFDFNEVI